MTHQQSDYNDYLDNLLNLGVTEQWGPEKDFRKGLHSVLFQPLI